MNMSQAVATAAAAEQERAYGTLRLLTLASLRLPDLVLYSHPLEGFANDSEVEWVPPVVVNAVRGVAAGALRLSHRALETHGREVGYETGASRPSTAAA